MSPAPPIAFVAGRRGIARWPDAHRLGADDVDREQHRFRSGHDVWVVQTYLLLREQLAALGYEVALRAGFRPGAIAVAHWDSVNSLFWAARRARVIGVRADRPPLYGCEVVVLQNDLEPDDRAHRFIPLWQQPGLLPRDSARGSRIETLAYFGRVEALPAWLISDAFRQKLASLGVSLRVSERAWHDYRDVDLVLSARVESALMLRFKPATKLYNAWLAAVPALLSDEPAFRALHETDLDYLPIEGPEDVIAAVRMLKQNPRVYSAMVARGTQRGEMFTRQAIGKRWLALIAELAQRQAPPASMASHALAMIRQKIEAKAFRRRHARELLRAQRTATTVDDRGAVPARDATAFE